MNGVACCSIALISIAAAAAVPAAAPAPSATPARSRADFARALSAVREGMDAAEVRRLLGDPDDVRTERDPGGITASRTRAVWRYGTSGHLTFATLGTVHIQGDDKVQYVFGGRGAPPTGIDEAELRRLLAALDRVPSYNDPLDPLALVRAVNALQPLGKQRALSVVTEYLRVASRFEDEAGAEGVFLVMRALFDPPPRGAMPGMFVGGADRQPPKDAKALPRWPLAIVDDIPLKLVGGYALAGKAEDPAADVAWFRANGVLRKAPLRPAVDPLEVIDRTIEATLSKTITVDDGLRRYLYDQGYRLVATVRSMPSSVDDCYPERVDVGQRWTQARAAVHGLAPRWRASDNQYVRADGSFDPLTARPFFPRRWWNVPIAGAHHSRLTVERKNDECVDANLDVEVGNRRALTSGTLRLLDAASGAVLSKVPVDGVTRVRGSVVSRSNVAPTSIGVFRRIALPPGHVLRAEWIDAAGKRSQGELAP